MAEQQGKMAESAATAPSRDDIWQAATLLVGVYGREAVEYADHRRSERQELGDEAAAQTWNLIVSQIEYLLAGAPATHLH